MRVHEFDWVKDRTLAFESTYLLGIEVKLLCGNMLAEWYFCRKGGPVLPPPPTKEHARRRAEIQREFADLLPRVQDEMLRIAKSEACLHSQDVLAMFQDAMKQFESAQSDNNMLFSNLNELKRDLEIKLLQFECAMSEKHASLQDQVRQLIAAREEDASAISQLQCESTAAMLMSSQIADWQGRQEALQQTLNGLASVQGDHALGIAQLPTDVEALRTHEKCVNNAHVAANKFVVYRTDIEANGKLRVHQILVECPGVCDEDIDITELPNGVGVHIAAGDSFAGLPVREEFEQAFFLDRAVDSVYELRFEECTLDKGLLRLVLQERPPPRLKLSSRASSIPQLQRVPNQDIESNTGVISLCEDSLQCSSWNLVGADGREALDMETKVSSTEPFHQAGTVPSMDGTVSSAKSDGSSSIKCYLPDTAFRNPGGNLVLVQNLRSGSQVHLSNGDVASVADVRRYPKDDRKCNKLVELITRHASFKVSAKHRIVVASSDGNPTGTRTAESLNVGNYIFVGDREQRITKVISSEERGELFMISFQPDGAVEAFLVPKRGMQTRGEPLLQKISEADLLQVTPPAYEE